ncbi:GDP-mannose transporter into the lumen of the Golgi [Modicella reniformis]|uniref:GDP-mannose transporter n=1 Tax=Modicella reniformis TaxID=1440133 RepID=A0A9P6M9B4_9FUNG|nr:GDP-mannose transporter into the lumen of the Golgi [Modicella reniformis]
MAAVILLWVFKKFDLIAYRQLDTAEAKKWFPISLALVAMIYTGSKSLQFLSIPVYTIFKNLTIILIAYGEVLWFGTKVTPLMLLSFAFMRMHKTIDAPDVRSALIVAILLSGVSSFLISYGSAWCVRCTSSTTYSMVGALNKLPVAASGILFLGDPATYGNVFGIFFGFIAGLLYSYSKTDQAQRNFALANGSSLSTKPSIPDITTTLGSTSGGGGEVIELTKVPAFSTKSGGLPLYKSNPDGKVAD